jgi:dipeptidase E
VTYIGHGVTKTRRRRGATHRAVEDTGCDRAEASDHRDGRRRLLAGVVLAGVSAGAICWFEAGVTDSSAGRLSPLACLGLLPGTCCPHYDGEQERRPTLHALIAQRAVPAALALDDGVAAHFVGSERSRVVTSRPNARAYEVHVDGDETVETELPVELLPKHDSGC